MPTVKHIVEECTQSQPLDKPKSLVSSKRLRNKRKAKQPNAPTKPCYNPPMYGGNTNSNKDRTNEPMHKKRKLLPSARKQIDYVEPKQAPKQLKEQVSRKNTESGLRRSP